MDYFVIGSSTHARPASERTLYCDGAAVDFREGVDLELSHWIPNRTPAHLKADTSTGICLGFARTGDLARYDLAVNNHVDVDGILSIFAVVCPELALAHESILVGAAWMGDFALWAEEPAQVLYQALTLEIEKGGDVYPRAIELTRQILAGTIPPEIHPGREALARAVTRIESGEVDRRLHHERFVSYELPTPENPRAFNALLDEDLARARARFDPERVQLVSTLTPRGWLHDLWYPGYVWADVVSLWLPEGRKGERFENARLTAALEELAARESAQGEWRMTDRLSLFGTLPGRGFPIVASFLDHGAPAPSTLTPEIVASVLAPVFAGS
jgi:hypothetical protein